MSWSELPEIEDVRKSLFDLAFAKSTLRQAELHLQIAQANMSKKVPRNTAARVVGTNEEEYQMLYSLQSEVLRCKADVDRLEAEVEFNDYRKDACKVMSYKGRV